MMNRNKKQIMTAVLISGGLVLGAESCSSMHHRSIDQQARSVNQQQEFVSAPDVKRAEEALVKKGFNPGAVDGVIDGRTQQALRDFQRMNNLRVTGLLDHETADKLGIKLSSESSYPKNSIDRTQPESPLNSGSRPGTGLSQ
jgi:peptidoglycan hydrolase-like protein with peptidoglycan-binding domain